MSYTPEEQVNRTKWDEVAPIHLRSYGLDQLRRRQSMLREIERRELGDLTGKSILHLQCHIGHDTLSLALEGGHVTGVDFSEQSIAIARQLADELQLNARFLVGNVLHLDEVQDEALDKRFDLAYTSNGVLCWIRDIELWAKNVADHLRDDGVFYIYEYHPFAYVFDEENETGLTPKYDYFLRQPLYFDDEYADYADPTHISQNPTYEWMWSVGDIQNALIAQGLEIEFFHEFSAATFQMFPFLEDAGDGYWKLPPEMPAIPLMFSMRARKRRT